MTLPRHDNLPHRASGESSAYRRLTTAGAGFVAAWRRPRAEPDSRLRHIEAGLVLIICGAIVLLALFGDAAATQWARGIDPGTVWIFARITQLGTSGYIFATSALIIVVSVLLQHRGRGRGFDTTLGVIAGRATFVFLVNASAGIASQILKHLFGRARPKLFDIVGPFHFDTFALNATFASFPSGHTITAFGTAMALGYFLPRLRWPLLALALLIGVSRVIVGAHYPSDVLAGAAIGIGAAILLRRAFLRRGLVFRRTSLGIQARGTGRVFTQLRRRDRP